MKTLGRPSKYDESMLTKAQAYVQHCQNAKEMPYIEELALQLGIHDDTIVEWAKENEDFSATVKQLKMIQRFRLKKGTLEKELHAPFAMFLLTVNHGLKEVEKAEAKPLEVSIRMVKAA